MTTFKFKITKTAVVEIEADSVEKATYVIGCDKEYYLIRDSDDYEITLIGEVKVWTCPCGETVEHYQYVHAIVDYPCRNAKCSKHLSDYNLKKV